MSRKPKSVEGFAKALGLSENELRNLRRKHRMQHGQQAEAKLERYLERLWTQCRDRVRIPARQNGLVHPPQYVSDPAGGIDLEPEAVDPTEIGDYRESRQAAARFNAERTERAHDLLNAIQQLKGAVYTMDPDLKKRVSRELWTLKGRIDTLERKLKREQAA